MEDSPQRRFTTQRVRHTNVTENLSVSVGQTFATVPMWKIRHTTVIGWGREGGWVGRVGVRRVKVGKVESGGWGRGVGGVGVGGLGSGGWGELGTSQSQSLDLTLPTSTPPTPTPRPQTSNSTDPKPNLSPLCGVFSTSALLHTFVHAYAQILGHIRCVANFLCGESSVANLLWRIFHVANL